MIETKECVCFQVVDREKIFSWMEKAARLTDEEAHKLRNSLAAEIIISTVFLSKCRDPERIIISHLCTLMAAVRVNDLGKYQAGESLFERIEAINHFPGGNPDAVKAGMLLLELLSLNDHKQDLIKDILACKNNPLIVDMDYEEEKAAILQQIYLLPGSLKKQFQKLFEKTIKAGVWF